MSVVLIGIDDTDNEMSPGTGQLARRLGAELARRGAACLGITRHQFLVDCRIPYTSHNSGACLTVEWAGIVDELNFATDLVAEWSAEGSDPGICIAPAAAVPPTVMDWGWRATREVLGMEQANAVARAGGVELHALGGTGQGIIGALGSVGLRADGNEGRFLELEGLRELGESTSPTELARLGIELQHCIGGEVESMEAADEYVAGHGAIYKTLNWVRPRLIQGRAVWPVEWSDEHDAWIPVDRKISRPLE